MFEELNFLEDGKPVQKREQSIESYLDGLIKSKGVLLHGARNCITDDYLKPNSNGEVFAADRAAVVIMRALISNKNLDGHGLVYPYFITEVRPFSVEVYGLNSQTIGKRGYVYIIPEPDGFKNRPEGSWQYIKRGEAPIIAKVEILRNDFNYPVYNGTTGERII